MKGTERAFIDGAETFYIKVSPRVHPEVRFTAMQCLPIEGAELDTLIEGKTPVEKLQIYIDKLPDHIKSWSLDRPPTKENLLRLRRDLVYRIANIVLWGFDGGDVDEYSSPELKDAIAASAESNKAGVRTTVANELERVHQGN